MLAGECASTGKFRRASNFHGKQCKNVTLLV